jgi:hypothetical protein
MEGDLSLSVRELPRFGAQALKECLRNFFAAFCGEVRSKQLGSAALSMASIAEISLVGCDSSGLAVTPN